MPCSEFDTYKDQLKFTYHIAPYLFSQSFLKTRFFLPTELEIIVTACDVDGFESESIAILLNFLLRLVLVLGMKFSFTESLSKLLALFKLENRANRFV